MGWWSEQVVPRLTDRSRSPAVRALRRRACADLTGDLLEVGFGSGPNVEHYPETVRSVSAVEPSDVAWGLAGRRLATSRRPVRRVGLDGQRLDLADGTFDSALSTLTMCTIPDLTAALGEIQRVLKPGGTLHFLEHGRSPDPRVARWQDRLQPLNGRLAGGCHLNRPIAEYLDRSGLEVEALETFYLARPGPFGYVYLGRARRS